MEEATTEQATYDLESVYDEQIAPLMAQIIEICKAHGMPMLASFAYRNTEEDRTSFCSTAINEIEARWPDKFEEMKQTLLRGTYA